MKLLLSLACFLILLNTRIYAFQKSASLFKALRVKTKRDYYFVIAQRNDSLFKIISKKVPNAEVLNLEKTKKRRAS